MELTVSLEDPDRRVQLYGTADSHLRTLREAFDVQITARDSLLKLSGSTEGVRQAASIFEQMQNHLRHHDHLESKDLNMLIRDATCEQPPQTSHSIEVYMHARTVRPRTQGQLEYVHAIEQNDLVFCVGPAGTGKTYLAVALAVSMLKKGSIRRIVLVRPAVEAGEKLGFLPGDLQAKVNPYLRPLFDALGDMMEYDQIQRFMESDVIEVIPLAFMRGRTLNEAVIILDEAQNSTISQMLMFLTRLGSDSRMIVTGDDSQIDLPLKDVSGLVDIKDRLKGIKGIGYVRLQEVDIVRHRLVQNIVKAYENHQK
ncbi:MAG: PhoH family protein [Planctomycetes bacterium]|nr:PhoH family protein [Planctomycetota bacterium]